MITFSHNQKFGKCMKYLENRKCKYSGLNTEYDLWKENSLERLGQGRPSWVIVVIEVRDTETKNYNGSSGNGMNQGKIRKNFQKWNG